MDNSQNNQDQNIENVPFKNWRQLFHNLLTQNPALIALDGSNRLNSRLLSTGMIAKNRAVLIIDDFIKGEADEIISEKRTIKVRGQYLWMGLRHLVSFNALINDKKDYKNFPALELHVNPPIQVRSEVYSVKPDKNRPVNVDIPIDGMDPASSAEEISIESFKVPFKNAQKMGTESRTVKDIHLKLHKSGETNVDGQLSAYGDEHIQVKFDKLSEKSSNLINGYIEDEYTRKHKGEIKETDPDSINGKTEESAYRKAKQTAPKALILFQQDTHQELYKKVLDSFDWETIVLNNYAELNDQELQDIDLLVIDVTQDDAHVVDLLLNFIKNDKQLPPRVVLVGSHPKNTRKIELRGLSQVIFIHNEAPESVIARTFSGQLNVKGKSSSLLNTIKAKPLVLAVDDEINILNLIKKSLTMASFDCIISDDPVAAIEIVNSHIPNLILLDIEMPTMSGLDFLSIIRNSYDTKNIPVIIISGYTNSGVVQSAIKIGISGFIAKPFTINGLVEKVRETIN